MTGQRYDHWTRSASRPGRFRTRSSKRKSNQISRGREKKHLLSSSEGLMVLASSQCFTKGAQDSSAQEQQTNSPPIMTNYALH